MIDNTRFFNPLVEDRIKPFWFWNSKLEIQELLAQIKDMYEKGVGGFFIHARFGLEMDYLSKEWFDTIRQCVEAAKRYGMEVWLYDENPFPSGIGGLKVSQCHAFRSRYVEAEEYVLQSGDSTIPIVSGEVLSVQCFQNSRLTPLHYAQSAYGINLVEPVKESTCVFVFVERVLENPHDKIFGIDYMNEAAVKFFIQTTHEEYLKNLGNYFGDTIKGIFTDEPTLLPWHQDINWYIARGNGRVVPWNPRIHELLYHRFGYGIHEILGAVFYMGDDNTQEVRRNFWSVVGELYENNFFKVYSEWCHQHGLMLTGHVLLEEGMYFNTVFQGNIIKDLEHLDIPGCDHLTNTAEMNGIEFLVGDAPHLPKVKTNIQGQKVVSSAAHLSGKKRVISESFGVGGWGLTLEDMRWIVNWQYVLGINLLCPHAFFYSIEGFRKCDAPPCHMHNTSWKYYRLFADYVARLSYVLSKGRHKADIAVLYPLSSFQSVYIAGLQQQDDKDISDIYDVLCALLPKLHYDYDIVGEHHLKCAEIKNGLLSIADEEFKVLMIPSLNGLHGDIVDKIQEFAAAGGKVIVFNEEILDDEMIYTQITGQQGGCYLKVSRLDLDKEEQLTGLKELLKNVLVTQIDTDISIKGEGHHAVYSLHRSCGDEEVFFFVNTSKGHGADVYICVAAMGYPVLYHPDTGKVEPFRGYEIRDNYICFHYTFAPCDSLLMGIRKAKPNMMETHEFSILEGYQLRELCLPQEGWEFSLDGYNVLPLSNWEFSIHVHGGVTQYLYKSRFEVVQPVEGLKLMLDDIEYRSAFMGHMDLKLFINGKEVSQGEGFYIDKKFITFPINELVKQGANMLEIIISHSAWSGEPHLLTSPAKILGKFKLKREDGTPTTFSIDQMARIIKLGSWVEEGYPYYSGTAFYTKEFILEALPQYAEICFSNVADCIAVYINGQYAGARIWRPWKMEISNLVRKGTNKLTLEVTNSLVNFIEGVEKPSGILGDIRIRYQ